MTLRKEQEPTPSKIARMANQEAELDRTALIGIFGSSSAPGALVRESSGRTVRVQVGDSIEGRRVEAIGDDHLVLARGGQTKVLRLP